MGAHETRRLFQKFADGPGYNLQTAEMQGKTVASKVVTGSKAKMMWQVVIK